jgi:EAL domain-containing protein (putative c-di-GMP-specific phosphodiesterase class I)
MLYYQPIVDLKTRAIKGVEALARWQHPERGVLMPDKFLDKITNGGLMQALTDFVIAAAIKQAGVWDKAGHKMTLSINVSASSLLDLSMPDKIANMCTKYNVPHERLILEVTETEAMRDVTRTMDVLLRMRLRNIGISIDDFGTGHSSLRELQRMPFSELKIDRTFINDSAKSADAAVIVASMIDLGHNLGLRIIAEGIEDQATWDLMRDKGCDYAQGFLIGHPMRAEDLDLWIEKWNNKS